MRILAAAINVAVGDWPRALRLICECIDEAVQQQCAVLAFPELTLGSIDARDTLKSLTNEETCQRLRIIAAYAYKRHPDLMVFIGHPWRGPSADTTLEHPDLPLTKRDKWWNAYSALLQGDVSGMSLKQDLDVYLSRLEERDYIGAKKIGITKITLPKTTYFTHSGKAIVTPEKIIDAGDIVFPYQDHATGEKLCFYPVIGDQAIKNITQSLQAHAIILNPTATPSTNKVQKQHDQLIQNTKSLTQPYIRINSFGGMNAGQGDILACISGKIITQHFSAPLTEKFCVNIMIAANDITFKQKTVTEERLTIVSQVRWLFDYLINASMPKVHVVLSITGDIISTYHLYLIHAMIHEHLNAIGLEALLIKLGYLDEKEKILAESHQTSLEKSILQRIITGVYLRHHPESLISEKEAQQLVTDIGGKFIALDTEPLIEGMFKTIPTDVKQPELTDDLNELAATLVTLGVGNIENGISIAHLTLDDLMMHPRFGGKLHRGQISPSSSLYRHQAACLLQSLISDKNTLTEKILFSYFNSKISENDLQRKTIAHFAIHETQHLSPLNVFMACQKADCFQPASRQEIFEKIMHFYQYWSKAQYGIHASPLTFNHNQQAIEHNMGMRTPNINGFQRAELAQLALYYYAHDKLSEGDYAEANERILIDESWQETLLHFRATIEVNNPLSLLKKTTCLSWDMIKKQRQSTPHHLSPKDNISLDQKIPFKITQASCNQTGGDWASNMKKIFHAIDIAVENDADLLTLPELCLSGYDCGDTFFWMNNIVIQSLLYMIADYAASKNPNLLISIGHPWKLDVAQKFFNVQSLLGKSAEGDAKILIMKNKGDLYGEERGFEHRYFSGDLDNHITLTLPPLSGKSSYTVPFGRKVVARIGNPQQGYFDLFQSICEEYWKRSEYDDGSGKYYNQFNIISEIKNAGYQIGLYITAHASPPSPHKFEKQKNLTALASLYGAEDMTVIHTDTVGSSGASYVNAGTRYAAQSGKIIVDSAGVYSFQTVSHNSHAYLLPRALLTGPAADVICAHVFKKHHHTEKNSLPDTWRLLASHEIESAIRNQVLALYDTMKKSRVRCFTQALSGGADSAWNIIKVRLMIELGIKELGITSFLESLHYPKNIIADIASQSNVISTLMKYMTICYYLATQNNSADTENAARYLIEGGVDDKGLYHPGIGGTFLKIDIQPLVNRFTFIFLDLKNDTHDQLNDILNALSNILKLRADDMGKAQYKILANFMRKKFGQWHGILLSPSIEHLGLTIENAQARIRQMLMSHVTKLLSTHPHLLHELIPEELRENATVGACFGLSNPNENEGRRAYTTFAGDLHSGETNPNGHLPKDHQLQQMQYVYQQGLCGLSPIKALHFILHQKPTAELQPKDEDHQVVQFDEKALGLSFAEATIINHARAQQADPRKVFTICQKNDCFDATDIATLHDKIYISYCTFPIALHKLTAAPEIQSYGEFTTSAKSSMQYPLISVNERYEIARFTLYCLNKLAEQNKTTFLTLSGYSFDACSERIMLNENFASGLHKAMYHPKGADGRPYKLKILYEKMLARDFSFLALFEENIFDGAQSPYRTQGA